MKWATFRGLIWVICLLAILLISGQVSKASTNYQFQVWQTDDGLPQSTVTSIVQTRDGYLWLGTQNGLVRFDGVRFQMFNENNTPAIKNNRIVQLFEDRQGRLWISAEQGVLVCLQNGRFTSYKMPGRGTPFNYAREICDDAEGNLWIISCEWQLICLGKDGFTVPSTNWNLQGVQPAAVASDRTGRIWVQTERELAVWQNGKFRSEWAQTNEGNLHVDLATSRTGGIWVAANNRLRKFESGHWVADLGSFAWTNSPVYDLYEDRHHRLWVATLGSGLFRYNPDGTVLHLTTKDGLPTDSVRCVTEDREGNIWVGMEGGGLCRLKPATFQALGVRQGLSSDQVMSMCESADGSYWIGLNGSGLDHLSDGRVEHYGVAKGLMNGHVWSVIQDRQGTIWVGTWDGLFKREQDRFVGLSDGVNIGWEVLAIYEDRQNDLWLGQQAFGALTRLHGNERALVKIPGATSSLDVRVIVQDRAGNLWVGTENEGLYRLKNGQCVHFGKSEGLASESVWSLRADDDGTLWIGTCGGGLSRWRAGKITTWTTRNGLVNDVICQILEDDKGDLWLGSYGGVFRVDKRQLNLSAGTNRNAIQCIGYDKSDGLPSVECVGGFEPSGFRSRDGRLWFPTVKGFAIVNPEAIAQNPLPPPVVIEGIVVDGIRLWPKSKTDDRPTVADGVEVPPGSQRLDFQYTALSFTDPAKVRFKYKLAGLETDWEKAGTKRMADYSRIPPGNYTFHVIACNNNDVWNDTGASLAITVLPYFWQTKWFLVMVVLLTLGSVAGSVRYVVKQKLQRRIEHIEQQRAIEAERGRIANDIHDDLGSGLTEIAILSELAQSTEVSSDTIQADVRKITDKARALTQSLDEIVWAMSLQNDTLDSFVSYACNYAQNFLQLAKIRCRLTVPAGLPNVPLTTDIRHNLFMVLKEALNNVVKHANASEVRIQITVEPTKFTLTISDNGKGFRLELMPDGSAGLTAANAGSGLRRNGLTNMRKRIENVSGEFKLESQPGSGTQIGLTVYLRKL